jgi:hypothetical protein
MADQCFNYTVRGGIAAPAGSRLDDNATGIRLPNGDIIKVWEQFELHPVDGSDPRDLTSRELEEMGCFYDGDLAELEDCGPAQEGQPLYGYKPVNS